MPRAPECVQYQTSAIGSKLLPLCLSRHQCCRECLVLCYELKCILCGAFCGGAGTLWFSAAASVSSHTDLPLHILQIWSKSHRARCISPLPSCADIVYSVTFKLYTHWRERCCLPNVFATRQVQDVEHIIKNLTFSFDLYSNEEVSALEKKILWKKNTPQLQFFLVLQCESICLPHSAVRSAVCQSIRNSVSVCNFNARH